MTNLTKEQFDKFFTVGDVEKLDCKVVFFIGNMYGKVYLYPTKENIFFKDGYLCMGVFDNSIQGVYQVAKTFSEFLKYVPWDVAAIYAYIRSLYKQKYPY